MDNQSDAKKNIPAIAGMHQTKPYNVLAEDQTNHPLVTMSSSESRPDIRINPQTLPDQQHLFNLDKVTCPYPVKVSATGGISLGLPVDGINSSRQLSLKDQINPLTNAAEYFQHNRTCLG